MPVAVTAAGAVEHADRDGLLERLHPPRPVRASAATSSGREAVVEHGERGQQRFADGLEVGQAPAHDRAQPRRHADLPRRVDRRGQLLRQERVAGRGAFDGAQRARRQRSHGGPLGDRRDRGAVERPEGDLDRGAALEQARSDGGGRAGERLVAHAGDDEQPQAACAAREVVQQRGRRLVGGVQVVDREQHAAIRGGFVEQLRHRVEHAMAVGARLGGLRRRQQPARAWTASRRAARRSSSGRWRTSGSSASTTGAYGAWPSSACAAPRRRVQAERVRFGEQRLDHSRLAQAERTADEQRATVAGRGSSQRGGGDVELALAPDHGSVQMARRAHRGPAQHLATEVERRLAGLHAEPRELVARPPELAGRRRAIAIRRVPEHQPAMRVLVGRVLTQHVLPAAFVAHQREPALAQALAGLEDPRRVRVLGQQVATVGGSVAALEALDVRHHLGPRARARRPRGGARWPPARRARGARDERPCAGSRRPPPRSGAATATRRPRRATGGGRERAPGAGRGAPRAAARTHRRAAACRRRSPRSARACTRPRFSSRTNARGPPGAKAMRPSVLRRPGKVSGRCVGHRCPHEHDH